MADLVFRSTTRGGRDFFEVTDDGMTYGGKDRYNIKTDESMNYADTVDEVLAELVFDGAWRINYDKIEVDELGIGKEYKEIVKLIRQKYNWLYNLPKGSKGRQFYFDIGRYFKQMIAKGTDYNKIFDRVDEVIAKNNNFEEGKKMNKKSMTEKYDWKIEPKDEDWSDNKYAYFLIHINIKRMAEYLNKEFKKDWWFKADFGQDYVWIVAEHKDFPVRLFFNFDEGGWADIVRHYIDGSSYTDDNLGSWHYAKYDIDYSFDTIKDNIKNYFKKFEESKKSENKSLKEYRGTIDELIDNWASYKEKNDYYIHMYGVHNFDQVNGKGIPLYEAHFRYNSKGTSLVETEVKFGYADYVTNMTDSTCQKLLAEIIDRWNEYKPIVNGEPVDYPDIPKAWFYPFAQIVAEVLDVPNQKILKQHKESTKLNSKSIKESFEYDGAIPLEELMSILTEEWQENNTDNSLFRESSYYEDEARDEGKYIEISSIVDFTVPFSTGYSFHNKRVENAYIDECNVLWDKYGENDIDYLNEYEPILFIIAIDLKDKIIYADVDLGNGLGSTEIARERLAENEKDFRKQIQRMIESF